MLFLANVNYTVGVFEGMISTAPISVEIYVDLGKAYSGLLDDRSKNTWMHRLWDYKARL